MRLKLWSIIISVFLLISPTYAWAKPSVTLKLAGFIVTKDAQGKEQTTPVTQAPIKPGEEIRYVITASNMGDQPALRVIPQGKIPSGTTYEPSSASTNAARVEFSLNGGKTWSEKPMITVHTPTGNVTKPAPTSAYTNLRWIADKSLAPKEEATYSYEVRVK